MRHLTLITLAALGLASAAPAFAQTPATTNPAAPSSSQAIPQSQNSLPSGSTAQSQPSVSGNAALNQGTSNQEVNTRASARHQTRRSTHSSSSTAQ